jgi:hypothetical protein
MQTVARVSVVVAALGLSFLMGCSTLRSVAGSPKHTETATAKSAKDVAACEKMCSVAGDAEDNKSAVDNCKKKCQAK